METIEQERYRDYYHYYPKPISLKSTEKILEQMRNILCKIKLLDGRQGIGFFCKLAYNNNIIPVLITSYFLINEDILNRNKKISITINNKEKEILLKNRIKYANKKYNISIIEIKPNTDEINNYLEIDDNIKENKLNLYINESIYSIEYEKDEEEASVSYGIINYIDEKDKNIFKYLCNKDNEAPGTPILNIRTNKVIGIHQKTSDNNIGAFLNYAIQDFILFTNKDLIEFKEKYNINIKDNNIIKLNLSHNNLGNDELKTLSKIKFINLKELYLYDNNISDIKTLEKMKCEQLEILSLGYNKISNINILEKVKFNYLKILYLYGNQISEIKALGKAKFEQLKELDLCNNKISDINALDKVNFKFIKKLDLSDNNIEDIKILEKVKFEKLEELDLSLNKVSDINILAKVNFINLKYLDLSDNNISDITILEKVKFEQLNILDLSYNNISDINILEKVNFKYLKNLYLSDNNISNINILENVKFEKLEKLDLGYNKISDYTNYLIINTIKDKIQYLYI